MKKLTLLLIFLLGLAIVVVGVMLPWQDQALAGERADTGTTGRFMAWPPAQVAPSGAVTAANKISQIAGNFGGVLANKDHFGTVAVLSDMDANGVPELAVGAPYEIDAADPDAGQKPGAVWVLFMSANGTVMSQTSITSGTVASDMAVPTNTLNLRLGDAFGAAVGSADLNHDGRVDKDDLLILRQEWE